MNIMTRRVFLQGTGAALVTPYIGFHMKHPEEPDYMTATEVARRYEDMRARFDAAVAESLNKGIDEAIWGLLG